MGMPGPQKINRYGVESTSRYAYPADGGRPQLLT